MTTLTALLLVLLALLLLLYWLLDRFELEQKRVGEDTYRG